MRSESTGSILGRMDEAKSAFVLRSLAAACFANAQSLYEDARLLYTENRVHGAYALAVIGLEEVAKAVLYTVAALRPSERGMLGPETRWHEVKHLVTAYAEHAQIVVADSWLVAEQESGMRVPQRARIEDLFNVLWRWGVAGLLEEPQQAKAFYARLQQKFPDQLQKPELKNASLYVDLLPTGEVVTPERVVTQVGSPLTQASTNY